MKKKLNKYSFGGFLKKVGNGLLDVGKLGADIGLSTVGLTDVIDNGDYATSLGKKTSKITDKLAPIAGQIVAGSLGGPGAAAAMQSVQAGGRAINGDPIAEQYAATQQREAREEELRRNRVSANQTLNNLPTQGVTGSGYYAEGGSIGEPKKSRRYDVRTPSPQEEAYYKNVLPTTLGLLKNKHDETYIDPQTGKTCTANSCLSFATTVLEKATGTQQVRDKGNLYNPEFTRTSEAQGWTRVPLADAKAGDRLQYWNAEGSVSNGVDRSADLGGRQYIAGKYPSHMMVFGGYQGEPSNTGARRAVVYNDGHEKEAANREIRDDVTDNDYVAYRYVGTDNQPAPVAKTSVRKKLAQGGPLNQLGSRKHVPVAESIGDARHPYAAAGTSFKHSKAVADEQRRTLIEDQNQEAKNVLNLAANVGSGGTFAALTNTGLGVWDTYDNYFKKNDFTPGMINNAGMLAKTVGKSPKVAMGMRLVSDGVDAINQYTGRKKLAVGGAVPETYEVEQGEVVQGHGVMLEDGTQHASDMHLVGGDKHSQGGTEGQGGERVFSDQLKPSGMKETYAELAHKLGKDKGRMEQKAGSMNEFARNTGKRMTGRVDRVLDQLFQHQEATKPVDKSQSFAYGGPLPTNQWDDMGKLLRNGLPARPTGSKVAGWQQRLKDEGFYTGAVDNKWGPKSQAAYDAYTQPVFQQQYSDFIPDLPQTLAPVPVAGAAPAAAGGEGAESVGDADGFMGKAAKIGGMVAPYVDNIVNAFIEPAQVAAPNLVSAPQLNTQVDISADLGNIDRQGRVFNQSIDNSTVNASTARANKIAAFAQGLSQTGQLYQAKRREESSLMNQQASLNAQADNTNAGIKNQYNGARQQREDNRLQMISANAANAAMDVQGQMRDKKMDENDTQRFALINKRFTQSGVVNRKLLENMISISGGDIKKAAARNNMTVAELEELLAASK